MESADARAMLELLFEVNAKMHAVADIANTNPDMEERRALIRGVANVLAELNESFYLRLFPHAPDAFSDALRRAIERRLGR